MNICESLAVTAKIFPDKTAIVFESQQITYAELNRDSICAAQVLRDHDIQAGDRVALMLPNAPCFPIWYYAVLRIGAIAVSVSTRLVATEVEYILSDCQAKAIVASVDVVPSSSSSIGVDLQIRVHAANGLPEGGIKWSADIDDAVATWYRAEPNEAALILYTSGTTGFPKGATLSHNNVRSNVHAFNHLCNMRPQDIVLLAVPLFHCFGQNALLNSVLNVGGTLVLQQRFDLNESKRLVADHQVTQLYGVPMMFGMWLDACSAEDLSSVNYCFSAAATLSEQISHAWQSKFSLPIHEGYGLTETSPFATYNHRLNYVAGSIGVAIDSVEVKILATDTGERCEIGELGEIAIRGPNVMLGYWDRPDETERVIKNGWLLSGDVGRMDENGYFFIVDRVKDMITVGGLKVFPAEVERVLMNHPNVSEAAVVGIADSVFGEQVVGFVVLNDCGDSGESLALVEQYAKSNLGSYKIPRRLLAIDEMPRNPSGKILKTALRAMMNDDGDGCVEENNRTPPVETVSNLNPASLLQQLSLTHESERIGVAVQFLKDQIRGICSLESDPDEEISFIEAGLDSLAIVDLSAQLQVEVGPTRKLSSTFLFDFPRVIDLAKFLVGLLMDDNERGVESKNVPAMPKLSAASLRSEIEEMSEEKALAELLNELK